ncbi:MAG: hypothetical protein RBT42_12915 [Aquabacterium sp.]|jgi:hypothetical protein|uniref:hypothetical protein n=1 Tax=Aquabacterium sp. TaxID=1872578 RepID=UPI002A3695CB|nr:hypothetical protein [Aquabacterium sp.]MDX9844641.1 hypothetical protein [Aquabacterium sp.]
MKMPLRAALLSLSGLWACGTSQAQAPLPPEADLRPIWWAVGDQKLSQLRGGFDLGTGLFVSFGISRAVYINNQLVTTTSFQTSGLDKLAQTRLAELTQQLNAQQQIVQNGPGNTVDASALTVPLATYIQNTLNNQTIRTETVIQASTNGAALLRLMNLQSTINEAVNRSIGGAR